MGRRVYLSIAVLLLSGRRAGQTAAAQALAVPARTLARWRHWWIHHFAATALWRAGGARFMPPVASADMPLGLLARFAGTAPQSVAQLLVFLSPISVLR